MSSVQTIPETQITPEEVIQQLRALRKLVPEFALMPRAELRSLAKAASVNAAFVQGTISAIGTSDPLRGAIGPTDEQIRQENELTGRWSSVLDEADAFRAGVFTAVTIRRHRVGLLALQAYRVAQQLVRNKDHANLLPYVEAMTRRAKFGSKRRPVSTEPETPPVPQSPQSSQ